MAWFTSFSTVQMDDPLFGDLENDLLFGRATFRGTPSSATIDIRKGTVDIVFRGAGDFVVGTNEVAGGSIRTITQATGTVVDWTLTGLSGASILEALERATHLDPVGDFGANIGINAFLLAGSDRLDDQSTGASYLAGYAGNDMILGNDGNDTLDGGSSADAMLGGDGDDTYVVDNAGDSVSELLNGVATTGVDKVQSSVSYTLLDNLENLTLTGTSTISGFGNSADNAIVGNLAGNDLRGRGGSDTLNGGAGDDTVEGGPGNDSLNGGTGLDTASYLHSAKAVTIDLAAVAPQASGAGNDSLVGIENLLGSQFNDSLKGNSSSNVLEGGWGDDTLNGATGTDTASYAHAKAAVTASLQSGTSTSTTEGADTFINIENLTGGTFNDSLTGDGGDNVLNGGSGVDTLVGGIGDDQFVFDNLNNIDVISDFTPGGDAIVLLESVFTGLDDDDPGVVLPVEFVAGAFTSAQTADQRIIYNTSTGAVYYDSDGQFGAAAVQIATLAGAPGGVTASDFHIG